MKTFIIALTLFSSLSTFSMDSSYETENLHPAIQELLAEGVEHSADEFETEYNKTVCTAYTQCMSGMIASCVSYGWGCRSNTFYMQGVSCTGYNAFGTWATWSVACF